MYIKLLFYQFLSPLSVFLIKHILVISFIIFTKKYYSGGILGIEPRLRVSETRMLPLHYIPYFFKDTCMNYLFIHVIR